MINRFSLIKCSEIYSHCIFLLLHLKRMSAVQKRRNILLEIYARLFSAFGPQGWWPGETIEEIIIGAVLTQNTNWSNVEKAINNLRAAGCLSLNKIAQLSEAQIARLIRPAGYFNIKARRLKATAQFFVTSKILDYVRDNLQLPNNLRDQLLGVYGIGRETADSILLYALNQPVFVVDAYTRRFCRRHGLLDSQTDDYESIRAFFESHLPRDVKLFNEYHALLVRLGKTYCRPRPLCAQCPLNQKKFFLHPDVVV